MILTAKHLQEQVLRDGIVELMGQCTEQQNCLLHRIHDNAPWKGLMNCPTDRLTETYNLLHRTVVKNISRKEQV